MKNVHILQTNEISKLIKDIYKNTFSIVESFNRNHTDFKGQHMYITNKEVIEKDEWCIDNSNEVFKFKKFMNYNHYRKIILTNDLELIKDGVESIDDSFLEWFVKNPTCEYVDVEEVCCGMFSGNPCDTCTLKEYKIITPVDYYDTMLKMVMIPKEYFGSDDEMMEVPMPISKEPKKIYTEQDMLLAAKYGYNFHKTTSFPEQEFDDSCVRNTQQWLTTLK